MRRKSGTASTRPRPLASEARARLTVARPASLDPARAGGPGARRLRSASGLRDDRGRRLHQHHARPRGPGPDFGAAAAVAARRVPARRGRGAELPARHVGRRSVDPGRGLYSPFGRPPFSGAPEEVAGSETAHHPSSTKPKKKAEDEDLNIPVEYAHERKIRERNKLYYRFNHWPIWIFVFFIAPGPLTFDLFERGFDLRMALWLGAVLDRHRRGRPARRAARAWSRSRTSSGSPRIGRIRSIAASATRSPGAKRSPSPCSTSPGWSIAIATGHWYLKQIYRYAYFPTRRFDLVPRRDWPTAARQGLDEGRGARAPVFLRHRVGGLLGAADVVAPVEGRAAHARRRCVQAGGVPRHPRVRGQPGAAGPAPTHTPDRAGGARRFGLATSSESPVRLTPDTTGL